MVYLVGTSASRAHGLPSFCAAPHLHVTALSLTLQDARKYESLAPATIGLVKSTGTFSLTSEEKDELSLRLEVESSRLGPLPYPTQSSTRRVLFLDALMCILAAEGGGYSVYVRPTMSRPTDDDE